MNYLQKETNPMQELAVSTTVLNVLYLEDDKRDAELIHEMLVNTGYHVNMDVAVGKKEYISFLTGKQYNLILADYKLPGFDAPSALKLAISLQPEVPFICVSGSIGEEQAVELLKQGATDYVLKDRLGRLSFAILRALEGAEKQKAKIKAEIALKELNEELETKVKQRTLDLENSNKALEAFSHSVSHDLRAPLRAINGFSRLLEAKYKTGLDPEGTHYVNVIAENSAKMDSLIVAMLAISKVSSGEITKTQIDMNKMIHSIYFDMITEEDKNKITLTISDLVTGYGDFSLIRQVWTNLLENAIKFTKNKESPTITISSYSESSQIVYRIHDNGVGFNQEYADKLFQLFQRLHPSREFEGTGIGLAIVDQIIQRHGGKVWAEGEEGAGAAFYFSLPIATGR